jgi:hypothetical protein
MVTVSDGGSLDDLRIDIHEVDREYDSIDQRQGGHGAVLTAVSVDFDEDAGSTAFHGRAFEGRTYVIRVTREDPRRFDADGREYPPIASAELKITIRGDMNGLQIVLKPREPK